MKQDIENIVLSIRDDIRILKEEIVGIRTLLSNHSIEKGDDLLTVNQVVFEFSINPSMIYNACSSGRIPFEKQGRSYRLKRQDVVLWIADMQSDDQCRTLEIDEFVSQYLQKNPSVSF